MKVKLIRTYVQIPEVVSTDRRKIWGGDPDWDGKKGLEFNRCLLCGIKMGNSNCRQLCRKIYCDYEIYNKIRVQHQITEYCIFGGFRCKYVYVKQHEETEKKKLKQTKISKYLISPK